MTGFVLLVLVAVVGAVVGADPLRMQIPRESRPPIVPDCRLSSQHFCAGGRRDGAFPRWWATDSISLFALSTKRTMMKNSPIEEKMIIYALGLHSANENKNYTLSYSPMSRYDDTVVPRLTAKKRIVWCNQAAVCLQPNISASWDSIVPVGRISGAHIAEFKVWVQHVNNSKLFLQPFLVVNSTEKSHRRGWISPFDSTVFFFQAIMTLKNIKADIRPVSLQYNLLRVTSDAPVRLGNASQIRRKSSKLYQDIVNSYAIIQSSSSIFVRAVHWFMFQWETKIEHKFHYFFNGEYWKLKVKAPYLDVYKASERIG